VKWCSPVLVGGSHPSAVMIATRSFGIFDMDMEMMKNLSKVMSNPKVFVHQLL
jgi:hypothetical protein